MVCGDAMPAVAGEEPVVVAYLASEGAARDPRIAESLERARREAYSVLPIGRDSHVAGALPATIERLNAMAWSGNEAEVALRVLEQFGLAERQRKLFLSYRQSETSALALQLRRALSERRFDVFLDRFSVPPGDDFQRRLNIELADKAFLLLLESPSAVGSDWVQHEVAFALGHRIAVLGLCMPNTDPAQQFEVVDEAFRLRLGDGDVVAGPGGAGDPEDAVLTDAALARVLREIEMRYSRQLRRRRLQLLGSLNDLFFEAGYSRRPIADWALLAGTGAAPDRVCLITPRAPVPHDFKQVDELRLRQSPDGVGQVIHETPVLDSHDEALIEWLTEDRPLRSVSLAELAEEMA
jgi:hypothetical protein